MHDSVVAGTRRLVRKAEPAVDGRTNRKRLRTELRRVGILTGARLRGGGLR